MGKKFDVWTAENVNMTKTGWQGATGKHFTNWQQTELEKSVAKVATNLELNSEDFELEKSMWQKMADDL